MTSPETVLVLVCILNYQCSNRFANDMLYILTHRMPVVWKLAQLQYAGTRYIRGRRTIYSYFKCQPLSAGSYVSSIKYEHFVQVSSNQKHVFIMFAGVRCGQESISKQPCYILPAVMVVLAAVTHVFRRVRK